jgi:hypothetical protein
MWRRCAQRGIRLIRRGGPAQRGFLVHSQSVSTENERIATEVNAQQFSDANKERIRGMFAEMMVLGRVSSTLTVKFDATLDGTTSTELINGQQRNTVYIHPSLHTHRLLDPSNGNDADQRVCDILTERLVDQLQWGRMCDSEWFRTHYKSIPSRKKADWVVAPNTPGYICFYVFSSNVICMLLDYPMYMNTLPLVPIILTGLYLPFLVLFGGVNAISFGVSTIGRWSATRASKAFLKTAGQISATLPVEKNTLIELKTLAADFTRRLHRQETELKNN